MKKRLDLLLLERQLASTRTKAQDLIREGKVRVAGRSAGQPGEKFDSDVTIELTAPEHPYVSRGGLKLEAALQAFPIRTNGRRVLDVGQSTGGFTHCLLLHGASEVVGIEVGKAQLSEQLRNDPRVRVLEEQDIRTVPAASLGAPFDLFVVDVSFISLSLVLPALPAFLTSEAEGVVLVKPQFEVGPDGVGSGGIVRDAAMREWATKRVVQVCSDLGLTVAGEIASPIEGGDGNKETLLHLRRASSK